jgi:hypothetical protein
MAPASGSPARSPTQPAPRRGDGGQALVLTACRHPVDRAGRRYRAIVPRVSNAPASFHVIPTCWLSHRR